jgi:hypothetical protein
MAESEPVATDGAPPVPATASGTAAAEAVHQPTSAPWPVILGITVAVMVVVATVMAYGLYHQVETYQQIISSSQQAERGPVLLAFSRSLDAAVVKTSSLFVAFLLVFLGGLFTLRAGEAAFRMTVGGAVGKGTLQTASPGLVMLSLGVLVVAVAIVKEQTVDLSMSQGGAAVHENGERAPDLRTGRSEGSDVQLRTTSRGEMSTQVPDETIKTLAEVLALVQPNVTAFQEADRRDWPSVRQRIEALRIDLALLRYPDLVNVYREFRTLESLGRSAEIDARDPRLAKQFREVQRLLGSVPNTETGR